MKGCYSFSPNKEMDPVFAEALYIASQEGVRILVYDSIVSTDKIFLDNVIPVF